MIENECEFCGREVEDTKDGYWHLCKECSRQQDEWLATVDYDKIRMDTHGGDDGREAC